MNWYSSIPPPPPPPRQQDITWANVVQDLCRHMASLDESNIAGDKSLVYKLSQNMYYGRTRKNQRLLSNTIFTFNRLRPRQNGRRFAHDIFNCISFDENFWILNEFSLKYVRLWLTIWQYWFRKWLGAVPATSYYLKQCWFRLQTHARPRFFFVRRAGLMRSQQDFEWWWSVPLSSASLYESFLLFCLICVYSSQFSISFWIMYLL